MSRCMNYLGHKYWDDKHSIYTDSNEREDIFNDRNGCILNNISMQSYGVSDGFKFLIIVVFDKFLVHDNGR